MINLRTNQIYKCIQLPIQTFQKQYEQIKYCDYKNYCVLNLQIFSETFWVSICYM